MFSPAMLCTGQSSCVAPRSTVDIIAQQLERLYTTLRYHSHLTCLLFQSSQFHLLLFSCTTCPGVLAWWGADTEVKLSRRVWLHTSVYVHTSLHPSRSAIYQISKPASRTATIDSYVRPLGLLLTLMTTIPVVSPGDSGDDFSNNLFSDLAPCVSFLGNILTRSIWHSQIRLLSLFGEQFAKHFMSQSCKTIPILSPHSSDIYATLGSPRIEQIIYIENFKNEETFGFYTGNF